MKNFETIATDFGITGNSSFPEEQRAKGTEDTRITAMIAAYKRGALEEANGFARAILITNPGSIVAWRHIARITARQRRSEPARAAWLKLTELCPGDTEPHLQLARLAYRAERWEACQHHAGELLRLQEDHAEGLRLYVRGLAETDPAAFPSAFNDLIHRDTVGAIELAEALLDAPAEPRLIEALHRCPHPQTEAILRHLLLSQRDAALLHEIAPDALAAAACYRRMLRLRPGSAYAQSGLTRLHRPALERARSAYHRKAHGAVRDHAVLAVRIDPTRPEPYILSGRAALAQGDADTAFEIFATGLDACVFDGWLALNHARAAARLNRPLAAARSYAQVLAARDAKSIDLHDEAREKLALLMAHIQYRPDVSSEDIRKLRVTSETKKLLQSDGLIKPSTHAASRNHPKGHCAPLPSANSNAA